MSGSMSTPNKPSKTVEEHVVETIPGGTRVRCSCGKEMGTHNEISQHKDWHMKKQIMESSLVTEAERATAKAYGGCKICYGKGYSTTIEGTIGYEDFGDDGFETPPHEQMKFCECDRGKQLERLLKPTEKTK